MPRKVDARGWLEFVKNLPKGVTGSFSRASRYFGKNVEDGEMGLQARIIRNLSTRLYIHSTAQAASGDRMFVVGHLSWSCMINHQSVDGGVNLTCSSLGTGCRLEDGI